MQGKIIKGIAGFYYVYAQSNLYECKAKGSFRNQKVKPLVGDNVVISVLDKDKKIGNIDEILPRTSQLIRPAVANVDQAIVIFANAQPAPNLNLLDRFLVSMEQYGVETIICFNKCDIVTKEQMEQLKEVYESCYQVVFTSTKEEIGIGQAALNNYFSKLGENDKPIYKNKKCTIRKGTLYVKPTTRGRKKQKKWNK